jgi:periplasmic divalent cation tolerance protein
MQSSFTPLLVLCSFPDENNARQIGTLLLEKQLAACVSFTAGHSIYRWQGKIESATETIAKIKTCTALFPALQALLVEHHPYEVPEVIGIPMTEINASYREWLLHSLADDPSADPV